MAKPELCPIPGPIHLLHPFAQVFRLWMIESPDSLSVLLVAELHLPSVTTCSPYTDVQCLAHGSCVHDREHATYRLSSRLLLNV